MSRTRPRLPRAGIVGILAGGLLAGLVVAAPPAGAGATNPVLDPVARRMVSGWMPYWTPDSSLASFEAHAELFGDVTGFWHSATGASSIDDQLSDTKRAEIVDAVHAKGVRILGAVTDGTAPRAMAAILTNKTSRSAHVKALVALATANDYDGIDLDYEKFAFSDGSSTWGTTRPAWVAFVKELSAALHAKRLWLTVAVPVMYDSDRDASSGYWVYDYAGIGPYVDRLRIMTYDYSVSSPGPIAPIAWVRRVLDYATTQVSPGKI
ncbi:MAG TPA: glycosyl hydrolase family 18 protein, partial [Candidatus Limnocylindria bacterium]|nr:glycosyl hydrolase family 18 protein [Candidatus Limnocylindria bacterium]